MTWDRTPLVDRYGSPSKRIGLTLTESTRESLRHLAATDGVTVSELVRDLIADEVARRTVQQREDAWTNQISPI